MKSWALQDAKARFSELLDAAAHEGPQLVTRRGVEAAVVVPIEEWKRLNRGARPSLKELLLADSPRVEHFTPTRRARKRRPPTTLG